MSKLSLKDKVLYGSSKDTEVTYYPVCTTERERHVQLSLPMMTCLLLQTDQRTEVSDP